MFTALSNILAAHLIVTGGMAQWSALLLLACASSTLYMAGMVLNDCFDLAEDARERPERPLPSGTVPVAAAWRLGWLLLGAGVVLAGLVGIDQFIIAALLASAVTLYDGLLKKTWAGSLLMGACRYLNWLLGLSIAAFTPATFLLGLPVLIYVASLTLLSGVETSASSRRPLLACAAGLALTAVVITILSGQDYLPHRWALLLVFAALVFALARLFATGKRFSPVNIQSTVSLLVAGIIPLDAMLAFAGGPWWSGCCVLGLMIPNRLLGRLMYVT